MSKYTTDARRMQSLTSGPSRRVLLAMLDDVTKQRNELQLLLCACVARAGGEVTLGGGLLRGLMERHRDVTLAPDGDGFRITLDLTALSDDDAQTQEAVQ